MKLLVCTAEYANGGIGNVAYNVVKQLKEMGVECTVCSPVGPDIKLSSKSIIQKYGLLGILYYWHRVSKYFKKRADYYDGVWLHGPLFIPNTPFQKGLITMHGTYHLLNKFAPSSLLRFRIYYEIAAKIEKYCLRKVDVDGVRFTMASLEVCKHLVDIGIKKERIIYIPNGVNTKLYKPSNNKKSLRKKFGIPEDDLIILSLARLTEVKQPFKLIEVFSVIEKEIKDITLVIGGKGELLNKTKDFVRQKKLRNIIFLGYVSEKDKTDLYACSDLYIMTSKYEGQPLSLLEAMASGLPPIVSNIPALTEFVEESKAGVVVDFNDTKMAANKIVEYLKDEQFIQKQSEQVRRFITNGWDWKDISRKYLEEFQKLIQYRNKGKIP